MVSHELLLLTEQSFVHFCYYALVEFWVFASGDSVDEVLPVLRQLVAWCLVTVSKIAIIAVVLILEGIVKITHIWVFALLWVVVLVEVLLVIVRLTVVVIEGILLLLLWNWLVVALVRSIRLTIDIRSIHLTQTQVVPNTQI